MVLRFAKKKGKAMAVTEEDCKDGNWLLDSGTPSHIPGIHNLSDAQDYSGNMFITIGNDLGLPISHIGQFILDLSSLQFQPTLQN